MHIFKDLLHSNQLIIEFVVGTGVGEERVTIRDEQVEYLHHLQQYIILDIMTLWKIVAD